MNRPLPPASAPLLAIVLGLALACAPEPEAEDPRERQVDSYLNNPAFRREALERALVNPDNTYSQLRLDAYTEDAWGSLPIWNPRAAPISSLDTNPPSAVSLSPPIALPADGASLDELEALGAMAFSRYPMQPADYWRGALQSAEEAERFGVWTEDAGQVGGLMWVELPGGNLETAATCATCHAAPLRGAIVFGLNNPDLDLGALTAAWYGQPGSPARAWGPGRLDVTADAVENPVTITDLRPVRHQLHLHRAATLENSLVALAIRIETLLVTSHGRALRPPREIAIGLALYLFGLDSPPTRAPDAASERGAELFEEECAACHHAEGYAGAPVPIALLGEDASVALSPARTTGAWRVPSLLGASARRPMLADGSVRDLDDLLDPARESGGHRFGLELEAAQREALLAFVETL